jgi:hypothetical protein
VINLNALLRRRVEYYEYPWAVEGRLRDAQSQLRSLFQANDVGFIFSKSMPRSGHRFLSQCLSHYFGPELHYCGFYRPQCCHRIPCAHPHGGGLANRYFMQKSHDFGFRDSTRLRGKYLIQYRSPIPRLQSNYDLALSRGTVTPGKDAFIAFAERETAYFINFYRKWVTEPQPNALAVAYEDLIGEQARTVAAVVSFVQGDSAVNESALARTLAEVPVETNGSAGAVRDPLRHPYYDPPLLARLEHKVAKECGKDRIRFHFL